MAFFGLTFLGYQDPFRDQRLTLPKHEVPGKEVLQEELFDVNDTHTVQTFTSGSLSAVGTPTPKLDLFYPKLPPIGPSGYDGTVHRGSHERYQEAVKRKQLQKYPNQEYRVPLTCGQDIGWWLPTDQSVKLEDTLPWMRVQRHPLLRSPMTKFADSMTVSNPLFSLF